MKKLILFLIAFVAIALSVSAQVTSPASQLGMDTWYGEYTFSATTDTSSAGGAWSKIIMPNKPDRLFYDYRVKVTEVSATTSATITFKGKKIDTDNWTPIDTLTYHGTGTDTTVTFAEVATSTFWRFHQIVIAPANGKLKTTFIKASFKR